MEPKRIPEEKRIRALMVGMKEQLDMGEHEISRRISNMNKQLEEIRKIIDGEVPYVTGVKDEKK